MTNTRNPSRLQLPLSHSLQRAERFAGGFQFGESCLAAWKQDQPVRDAVESGTDKLGSQSAAPAYLGNQFAFDVFLTHT